MKKIYIYIVVIFYLWNKKKEKVRNEINEWIRRTKPIKGGFDAFFDYDKELKSPKNETMVKFIEDETRNQKNFNYY